MTTPNEVLRSTATEPGAIAHDCSCRRCGYNLRTLLLDGQCPECGAPVAGSRGTPTLLAAPRDHLVRLLVGTVLMVVATATFGVLMLALTIAAASGVHPVPIAASVLVGAAGAIGAILLCSATGLVLLTRRDPRFLVDPACSHLRHSLLAALCAGLAAMSALPLDTKSGGQPLVLVPAAAVLLTLLFALPAQVVGHVARLLTLPRAARNVEWLFPAHPFLLLMLLSATTIAVRGNAMGWLPWCVGVIGAAAWLCAFGYLCAALWSALRAVNAGR